MIIEVYHPDMCKASLQVNNCLLHCIPEEKFRWRLSEYGEITIAFQPWKIRPILRINNFLINYWLGNILLQDHGISFKFDQTFFPQYRAKDLQGRLDSLGENPSLITIDRVVGRCLHQDLIDQIKDKLIENGHPS